MVLAIVAVVLFIALAVAAVLAQGSRSRRKPDVGPPPGVPERRTGGGPGDAAA